MRKNLKRILNKEIVFDKNSPFRSLLFFITSMLLICQLFSLLIFNESSSLKIGIDNILKTEVVYNRVEEVEEVKSISIGPEGIKESFIMEVSMYTSSVAETDSSPCISANGTNICEGIKNGNNYCASNEFEFGTELSIDGTGHCIVVDRMNSRYKNNVDYYAGKGGDAFKKAINFGRRDKVVVIIK